MPEPQPRLLAGRYELRRPIGRGTMGTVWRAFDRSLGREVAVKEIRQDPGLSLEQRRELRERMLREGRMAARVSHPSVAAVHDAIEVDGKPWIIMELVEGRSLEQVVDEEGPLPPRLVAEIGYELLDALRAAHARRILHRDVKPSNVLLTQAGRVVLTDFGIAKSAEDTRLTRTGMVIGSPGYTAPERARGIHTGPESDLWSLGATLYFAVEGRPAYERGTVSDTLNALMTETADPPTRAGPLRPVIEGLLEKDHRARLTAERAAAMLRIVADTPTGELARFDPAADGAAVARSPEARTPDGDRTRLPPDAERTMVLRVQRPGAPATPDASDDAHEVTVPARRPRAPMLPAAGAVPGRPGDRPPGRHLGGPEQGPARAGAPGPPGTPPPGHAVPPPPAVPEAAGPANDPPPSDQPEWDGPAATPSEPPEPTRPRGLGTDLFSVRSPSPPDVARRVRVLVLIGIGFLAFIALVVSIMIYAGV